MPRIRCHYEGCIHLEASNCSADVIELDPEMGCLTFAQEEEDLGDEEDWDDVLLDEEEEIEDWEDLDEELDEDELDLDEEEEEW